MAARYCVVLSSMPPEASSGLLALIKSRLWLSFDPVEDARIMFYEKL
jgi:hypothetical protein